MRKAIYRLIVLIMIAAAAIFLVVSVVCCDQYIFLAGFAAAMVGALTIIWGPLLEETTRPATADRSNQAL